MVESDLSRHEGGGKGSVMPTGKKENRLCGGRRLNPQHMIEKSRKRVPFRKEGQRWGETFHHSNIYKRFCLFIFQIFLDNFTQVALGTAASRSVPL